VEESHERQKTGKPPASPFISLYTKPSIQKGHKSSSLTAVVAKDGAGRGTDVAGSIVVAANAASLGHQAWMGQRTWATG
jgi:hypothetical protein